MVPSPLILQLHPEREELVDRALEVLQPLSPEPLTRDDAREAIDNLARAYLILLQPSGGAK